jgi:hypothetical protein
MKHKILWAIATILAHCFNDRDLEQLSIYARGWRAEMEADWRLGL